MTGRRLALLLILVATPSAHAQGTARVFDLDTSVRSAGMGGASNAVFWGEAPNDWANPALLGYRRGIRHEYMYTVRVPLQTNDVEFHNERTTLGGAGIGIAMSGRPIAATGNVRLDYGVLEDFDFGSNASGRETFEHARSWGLGVSLATALESAFASTGRRSASWLRFADFAAGVTGKRAHLQHAPPSGGVGISEVEQHDVGWLLRVTPFDSEWAADGAELPFRIDASFGHSTLGWDDASADIWPGSPNAPTTRIRRYGFATRVRLGMPVAVATSMKVRHPLLARGLEPLLSIGVAFDRDRVTAGDDESFAHVETRWGAEATCFHVATVRVGYVRDPRVYLAGTTLGFGLTLPIGDIASASFDWASVPEALTSAGMQGLGYAIALDPIALARELRPRP